MIGPPLEGPSADALARLQQSGEMRVPMSDACGLLREIRRRNYIKTHRLGAAEVAGLPADYDPGPEFD